MSSGTQFVQLLGRARVRTSPGWWDFGADKRYYLLGYLAYWGEWVRRDRLAYLFWPDAPSSTARNRLRQLLRRAHALEWLDDLEVEPARLRWNVETDVGSFLAALGQGDWSRAFDLYQGPLLDGVEGDDAPEFATWLELERATLHHRWRALLLEQGGRLQGDDRHRRSIPLLEALLQADELDEEALRAFMTAAYAAGQRLRALDAYERFAEHLQDALGLEPALATKDLADAIRRSDAELAPPAVQSAGASGTPLASASPANPFVGRDAELRDVRASLAQPSCRMLTLVGLGGVGKSRIAMQVCHSWEGRAHFVRLDGLASAAGIPAAIAEAVGCATSTSDDLVGQIIAHLGGERVLLVLDDYDHLTAGANLTSELLRACPSLAILVTSRERLGVPEEWVYEVPGLRVPAADVSLEGAQDFEAVRLFTARAAQVRRGYRLTDDDLPHVLRICRLVQGLPLGLELAAAWMRSASAEAIADEVAANADFLRRRSSAERHESIRAVFESSWQMLTREEQQVLARLSVFRGGFTRDAAETVTRASTPVLAALADKSLLELLPEGRYDRHPLLYQYVSEKHAQHDDRDASHKRHARYFVALAEQLGSRLRAARHVAELDALEADHENLRAALAWGLANEPSLALRLAGALGRFWEIRGHLLEGCGWLEACLAHSDDALVEVEARALAALGRLLYLRGDRVAAERRIRAALERWRRADDDQGISSALNHLGALAMDQGAFARAEALYQEALDSCRARGDQTGVANLLNNLGEVARLQHDHAAAEETYRECLAMHRSLGNQRGIAITLGNLGFVVHRQGRVAEATTLFHESIALKRHLGDEIGLAYCLAGLAGVLCDAAAFGRAARLLGAAASLLDVHSVELDPADRADYERSVALCRAQLGGEAFAEMAAEGRAMEVDSTIDLALQAGASAVDEG